MDRMRMKREAKYVDSPPLFSLFILLIMKILVILSSSCLLPVFFITLHRVGVAKREPSGVSVRKQ